MSKPAWPAEREQFLRDNWPHMSAQELANAFNQRFGASLSAKKIKNACRNRGIRCGRARGQLAKGKYKLFTEEQAAFLKEQYKHLRSAELAATINERFGLSVTATQVSTFCKNHGFTSGRSGRFAKGHVPFCAGTKGLMKRNAGSFKKNMTPHNTLPVGAVVLSTDGFYKQKIAEPNQWEYMHRRIWINAHGPIPKGHTVAFRDGDRSNISLENLELVSRRESALRSRFGYFKVEPELKEVTKTLINLRMKRADLRKAARA